MNGRVVISIVNLVAIVAAFVVLFEYPQYESEALYVLIAWMVGGFLLLYVFRPRPSALADAPLASGTPFPSTVPIAAAPSTASESTGGIGFCIYCAAPIAPGTRACPACGHALPRW